MKRIFTLALACSLIAISSSANAWFFFFLPGSVTSAIGDAITGSEGEHCVGENAKVGDNISLSSGGVATIKSLSGTSTRCTNPERPIRAKVEPTSVAAAQSTTSAKIDLPDGWEPRPLTDAMKIAGSILLALNRTIDSGLGLLTTKRSGITDMLTFANTKRASQAGRLQDAQQSAVTQLVINGLPAWRFDVTGKVKSGQTFTYLHTIFESDQEIVTVLVWASPSGFALHKESLLKIVDSLTGLPPPVDLVKEAEAKKRAAEEETRKLAAFEDAKRLAAEEDAKRVAAEEAQKQTKGGTSKKTAAQLPSDKVAAGQPQQVDFDVEASKAARILGCQPLEVKVTGAEGGNIQYRVACDGSKSLLLSCDPSGLCLQKKSVASSKRQPS
jgi:hypothetical protein